MEASGAGQGRHGGLPLPTQASPSEIVGTDGTRRWRFNCCLPTTGPSGSIESVKGGAADLDCVNLDQVVPDWDYSYQGACYSKLAGSALRSRRTGCRDDREQGPRCRNPPSRARRC
jgi:hypothetical protein